MDSGLHHFCNREFCRALRDLRGHNFLLLLLDGSAVFGQIGRVDDWVVSMLPVIGVPGANSAFFHPANDTPAPLDIPLSEVLVDVCDIAAAVEGRFVVPPLSEGFAPVPMPIDPNLAPKFTPYPIARQQGRLLDELAEFKDQNGGVLLLGGWVIAGQLGEVCDCMTLIGTATITAPILVTTGALNIFGPAVPGGMLSLCGKYRAWVNLKTLTSILLP
ncbi:MAG: hypothetical protein P4N59_25820 [Negativicutes bacterium]|nr:hypothetical protein [Negativicutes bacterium]